MNKPCLCCFVVLCAPALALAASVTLHPVADTTLFSTFPTNNLGASLQLAAGANGRTEPRRALIRFNLAGQIPTNATIQSVSLTMKVVAIPATTPASSTFALHRLLVDWGEGAGTGTSGSPARNGEATWRGRFYPQTLWNASGAAAVTDFSTAVSGSVFIGSVGSYTFSSTPQMVDDVQGWLTNSQSNFGWLLLSQSERTSFSVRRFAAREDVLNAPSLKIQYTTVTSPQVLGVGVANGNIAIQFLALSGQSYAVEYRDSLTSGTWSSLTNLPPQTSTTNQIVSDPIVDRSQRFYRIGTSL
jgi:hypothetical protein